jgi:hypothetical protein
MTMKNFYSYEKFIEDCNLLVKKSEEFSNFKWFLCSVKNGIDPLLVRNMLLELI